MSTPSVRVTFAVIPGPMLRNLLWPIVALGGLALALAGGPQAQEASPIGRLAWLAGCWESVRGERRIEEQWMRPRGGTMLGMSRTVTGDRTIEFEYMQIREQEGRLVFTSKPSGQQEASFDSISLTASEVVFEDAAHDFPQRIMYRHLADGSLQARIEGKRAGTPQSVDFPMRPAVCGVGTR